MSFDVIIIGGGAAGLSAALWCDELALSALLLEREAETGGQLLWTYNAVKNHLGVKAENGRELRDIFVRQTENRNFSMRLHSEVVKVDFENRSVLLKNGGQFSAKALIIATGVRRRKLGIEGEEEFKGRGVLTSGKRDRDAVKDKTAVIVGGGDAALENSLILAETASKVIVIHRRSEFSARAEFVRQAKQHPKIEFLTETIVKKISGDEKVKAVDLLNSNGSEIYQMPTDAVLIRIGVEPNTDLFRGKLELDENGYIKVNHLGQTNVEGVWAIGDVANPNAPTVSSAVGMGATAVKNISIWLNS